MGAAGSYLIFGANGQQLGGMFSPPTMPPSGPRWLTYIEVASADESIGHAVKAGGRLCFGPVTVPGGGRIANFIDPEGAMFAVHASPAAMREAGAAKPAKPRKPSPSAHKRKPKTAAKRKGGAPGGVKSKRTTRRAPVPRRPRGRR
jgi:hypothetical protein